MSKLYPEKHRALQDKFDALRIADKLEPVIVHSGFAGHETSFIQSADMFFLSTVDAEGRPAVSYKGGAPGFVKGTGPPLSFFHGVTAMACITRPATSRLSQAFTTRAAIFQALP